MLYLLQSGLVQVTHRPSIGYVSLPQLGHSDICWPVFLIEFVLVDRFFLKNL